MASGNLLMLSLLPMALQFYCLCHGKSKLQQMLFQICHKPYVICHKICHKPSLAEVNQEMIELLDKQVNAQKEKNFWGSLKSV